MIIMLCRQPWFYLNDDVVEATTLCLTAQADDLAQKATNGPDKLTHDDEMQIEQSILREFGRCLHQVITSAQNANPTLE